MIVGKLMVILGLDKTGFDTGINSATGKTTAFKKVTDSTFKAIQKGIKVAMIASAVAVVKAVKDFGAFEKQLANVSTMLSKDTMPMMKDFEKGILSMAASFGEGTETLSKGLYDILSASVPASMALDVLETSAIAAKAGMSDTGTAADALTTMMNSFGDASKDANYYSDILFSAVKFGKTTFGELAGSVGNVATLFATAGGSAEELSGMISILTRNGINTNVAMTNIKGIISTLLKPTDELTEALDGMNVKTDGFAAIMQKVSTLPPADLAEIFPNVRALTGVVVAAKDLETEVEKINDLMAEGSPSQEAYAKQTDTLDFQWNQLKATLKNVSIAIGKEVAPQFKVLFGELTAWFSENQGKIAEFFKGFVDTIKDVVGFVGKFKDVILGVGIAIATLSVLDKAAKSMQAFGLATSIGLGPIAAVAAAVGLLVVAMVKINKAANAYMETLDFIDKGVQGNLTSAEEYARAIDLQNKRLDEQKKKSADAIARAEKFGDVYGTTAAAQKLLIEEEERKGRVLQKNHDTFVTQEAERIQLEKDQAELEMQISMDNAAAFAKEQADAATRDALEKNRLAQLEAIRAELADSKMTAEERYDAEIQKLIELGLSQKEVMDYMALTYKEFEEDTTGIAEEELAKITKAAEDEYNKMVGKYYAPQSEAAKNMWAQFGDAANEAFGVVEEQVEVLAEEVPTFLEEMATFITDDIAVRIYDAFANAASAFVGFIQELAGIQIAAIEEEYSAKTQAELDYDAFLTSQEADRKKERTAKLAQLKKDLKTETDAVKKAELEKQIAALETEIQDEELADAAAASRIAAEAEADAKIKEIKKKAAIWDKALRISMAVIDTASAVIKALVDPGGAPGVALSVAAGILGGLTIAKIAAEPIPMIKGGVAGMTESGVFSGKPGIDTNNVALTTGEYVMPPEQTRNNIDELEAMRSGSYGGGGGGISPVPVSLYLDSEKIGEAMIEFITAESDGGRFRMNPKVLGVP